MTKNKRRLAKKRRKAWRGEVEGNRRPGGFWVSEMDVPVKGWVSLWFKVT